MNQVPVKSSNLLSVGYDPATHTLQITFKGSKTKGPATYKYANVPPTVHTALLNAKSKGTYVAEMIRGKFPTEKVK